MTTAPTDLAPAAGGPTLPSRRPAWALPVVVIAVIAVLAALVWGVRGLFGNPVVATAPDGTVTLQGSWAQYQCCPAEGYVQAGARSVFVILAQGCPQPAREQQVTLHGRLDQSQGKQTYRALDCPTR